MSTDNFYFSYGRLVDIYMSSINGYELVEKIVKLDLNASINSTYYPIVSCSLLSTGAGKVHFLKVSSSKPFMGCTSRNFGIL